jgi:hypothetical protein
MQANYDCSDAGEFYRSDAGVFDRLENRSVSVGSPSEDVELLLRLAGVSPTSDAIRIMISV